jgi:hypothetical protein
MHFLSLADSAAGTISYASFLARPTLTHSAKQVDALRKSRIECISMMETTKLAQSASRISVVGNVISTSVSALGILIVGVLLITGCGPPS